MNSLVAEAVAAHRAGETNWRELTLNLISDRGDFGYPLYPPLLERVWRGLPPDQVAQALADIWRWVKYPEHFLPRQQWVQMFTKAGFHGNGGGPSTPPESIRLWRGGEDWGGLSWTPTRGVAELFSRRFRHDEGVLWVAEVPRRRLLACYFHGHTAYGDPFVELVTNTRGMDRPEQIILPPIADDDDGRFGRAVAPERRSAPGLRTFRAVV